MTSSIFSSSELYPLEQKIMNIIINIKINISNKKKPAFDLIFSFDVNTLHDVIQKLDIPLLSSKPSYNLSLSIFISAKDE